MDFDKRKKLSAEHEERVAEQSEKTVKTAGQLRRLNSHHVSPTVSGPNANGQQASWGDDPVTSLAAELTMQLEEIRDLQSRVVKLEEELTAKSERVTRSEVRIKQLTSINRTVRAERNELRKAAKKRDRRVQELERELSNFQMQLTRLRELLKQRDEEAQLLSRELALSARDHLAPVNSLRLMEEAEAASNYEQTDKVYEPEHIFVGLDGNTLRANRRARLLNLRRLVGSRPNLTEFEKIFATEKKSILSKAKVQDNKG